MAAHRIIRVTNNNHVLPRCKSEGTLIDLSEGVTGASLNDVKVPSPSALRLDTSASYGDAQEVVAIKDYCPSSFTTLKFSKGDHLYVLDTSGGEWWYAHNNTEMGYIPAAYVQPVNFRNSSLSDSGMIDSLGEGYEDGSKEFGGLGEWTGMALKPSPIYNSSPFSVNPFICQPDQNSKDAGGRNPADLILFDALAPQSSCSNFNASAVMTNGFSSCHVNNTTPTSLNQETLPNLHRDNPFFRSKRSHSLSELSVLQAQSNPTLPSSGFFTGLKAPSPEQFQSREDFRTAWLNHRKLARSCHDLDSLGQSPGWGQTQPVETNIVCRLDSNGGVVQLPDTHISAHIPEGHVSHGDYQQISMKALLDPPLELNSDRCTTVSPVVEVKLSNMETKSFITLEMKVLVTVKKESCHSAEVLCVRSDCKEGPYTPIPNAYIYKDTIQVQLDSLEPCMYVAVVVQAQYISHNTTVWDHMQRKVTLGVYGPKHIHPSFKTVVAMFGHDCAPKTLLVSEVGRQASSNPPVALQLWGKHQFMLGFPQDLQVGLYSNMSNYQVKASEGAGVIQGFQVKLGKVSRLLYMITSLNPNSISDFTLRVQVKDALDCILTQFCVQTPQPPPKAGARITGQRRFLKKKEVDKIVLSPLAVTSKYPKFQDRCITNLKFGKLIKTVIRQHKSTYLLEYKKGDVIALLSEEKIKLRGQLRTKEWYIGYYQGKIGLVHAKNVLVLGKVKPIYWCGPDLTTMMLLEQILKPCKFLTYIYATVRTVLMENVGNWRAFADALGYGNLPLNYFCRTELDNEPEKVASVLEKLKEECTNTENKERKSFQRELMMALLKMDCQGLVARLVLDFVLLTTAVEVASRWRELAEKLARVSRQQMEAYEAPHRDKNGLLDNEVTEDHADPETTLLSFLRDKLRLTGTKYGCGGGGCGACTVMVSHYQPASKTIIHYAVNACLLPICQLHGAAVTTVEGVGSSRTRIHPVQERIAKAHGSQCGFCTPGMVMSMYTLLRNKPQPTMEDITQALAGNLCRCTGYRPIVDGCRTFCQEGNCCQANGAANCCLNGEETPDEAEHKKPQLFDKDDFVPLDPTQELIFPPELILMAETPNPQTLSFRGERMSWVSPASLEELVQLKTSNPAAPLVLGNTNIGPDIKFKGVLHPLIISPTRVRELFEVTQTPHGVWVGAGCSLSEVRSVLEKMVPDFPEENTELFRALIQQLGNLGNQQIRNVASLGGNIMSAYPNSDLNPVLAAGNSKVSVISGAPGGRREVPLNRDFFVSFGKTILKPEEIVVSVFIPFSRKGEFVRVFRQAPRKESSFATVTAGMRVFFSEGSREVQDLSIYFGGMGPTTVSAAKTCAAIVSRPWDDETLSRAYDVLLDELVLPPSAPGGKVEFRRSLTLSFLFKFNLEVLQKLKETNVMTEELPELIQPLPRDIQPSLQEFQHVSKDQSEQDPVGRPIMHRSAISQATGEAVYCDDIPKMDGELFLVLVTSSRAHAKITGLDASEALRLPGVVDVITAKDIPGKKARVMFGYEEELLAQSEVSCIGQMVCAVVADTRAHAKRGAAAVKISYEDLPDPIFTVEEAIEKSSFFEPRRVIARGDVTEAFKTVDQVYEGEVRLGGQEHFYMETQSMLVVPVGEETELDIYVATQWPALMQDIIAEALDIPSNRVTCHVKRIGGAFGGKLTKTAILSGITAVAAWKTGRAVRCVLERGEDMLITGARHPVLGKYKVGFMNDGRIVAADVQFFSNGGNTIDDSVLVGEKMLLHMDNAYNIPNLRGRVSACMTNLPSNTAFRGFGVPQSLMIVENMLNDVAMVLGRPADQIQEINMYKGPSVTHYKFEFSPENMLRCWEECKIKAEYGERRRAVDQFNRQNRWKKRGMSIIPIKYGVSFGEGVFTQAAALVHIYKDGSVLVSHGGTEMGQGIHTKMQQVASRELHIPSSKIYISETSTNTVPNTCPSAASFGTDANGMAVKNACETLYKRLEPIRQKYPKGSWESWVSKAFVEKISLSATGFFRGQDLYMDWENMKGEPYAYFTYGVCCCEVELDCLTGDYRTVRTDLVVDIGRSVNPSVDIGQIEGAFMQGLGLFTMEELKFSPSGLLYTRGPSQYKIPAVCDVPLRFNVYLLSDSHNPHAIYSSKGIGEPILFLGSSVFFAIKDAVAAARSESGLVGPFSLDSPATPERACLACASPFTKKIPASEPGSFKPWALNI